MGLGVLSLFFNKLLQIVRAKTTPPQDWIDLGFIMALIVIIALLTIGFQRTACLEGQRRQSPLILFGIGMQFFWRMVILYLIYILVIGILVWLTFLGIKLFISIETGFWQTYKNAPIVYHLCFTMPAIILIKPLLLAPPLIIVLNCQVSQSFKLLKQCKLRDAKELVILYLISIAVAFLPSIESTTTTSQYVLIVALSIIQQFIGLMIAVMAVRFVASLNLVYDDGSKSVDSKTLLKL